ncbi:Ubiquinone biosynthesis protein coq9, mitochondrial [Coelomomyces lativittatus]|nr:Ubiquinone biosynthesis protein coq9, mitochondrial [Coelomomyces lativittatus]KAJ1506916.1 Ubiquinone biosynthesis protein coq9, mitochondrial [Coelomomyces lativittatus]
MNKLHTFHYHSFHRVSCLISYRSFSSFSSSKWNSNSSSSSSSTHTAQEPSLDELRFQLLSKALELVPHYSFSQLAIQEASLALNFPMTLQGIVPKGSRDLIEFFLTNGRNSLLNAHKEWIQQSSSPPGITKTVMHLTKKRLEYNIPYIRQWPDALHQLARPSNLLFSFHQLQLLIDEIWYLAGDQSFDYNYYTKRALLTGIYTSSELYMTTDTSPDFQQTFEFMNARFHNTKQLGDLLRFTKEKCEWGKKSIQGVINSR